MGGMKYLCILLLITAINMLLSHPAEAIACARTYVLFARGSGQEYGKSEEARIYSTNVKRAIANSEFIEIRYPAVAIDFRTVANTVFSASSAYNYNNSVSAGKQALANEIHRISRLCPDSQIALIGYSQGAHVMGGSLSFLAPHSHRIIYTALLGDPKLNLPEGRGINPPACSKTNYSIHRAYAPNCHTDNGILSARSPYVPEHFRMRSGTYCADRDLVCGSSKNPFVTDGHYVYSDQRIVTKVINNIKERISNPQTTPTLSTSPSTGGHNSPRFPHHLATIFFVDPCYIGESRAELDRVLSLNSNSQIMAVLPMSALYEDEHNYDAFVAALNSGQPFFSQRLLSYLPVSYTNSQRLLLEKADEVGRRAPCVTWSDEHMRGGVPSRFMEQVNAPAASSVAVLVYPFYNGQMYKSDGRFATISTCLTGFYGTDTSLCQEQRRIIDAHYQQR